MYSFDTVSDVLRSKIDPDLDLTIVDVRTIFVFGIWEKIVGQKISRHTQPIEISENILIVTVDDTLWIRQLEVIRLYIVDKLNKSIGYNFIKEIKFSIGKISKGRVKLHTEDKKPLLNQLEMDSCLYDNIDEMLIPLKDLEISALFRDLIIKDRMLKKKR
ncbi:MAG: DUF721 domain-containing protein [bacterium]